ncbi:MAG: hypothetical protein ABI863_17215 [Ginsengibacter sp.]
MNDPGKNAKEKITNKLTRRKVLRDSAITAAGMILLPSLITGCTKEQWDMIHGHGKTPDPDPGWIGGFAQSNPAFAYPNPDLSSLPLLDNMANIDLLERQQAAKWPEFSWETEMGESNPRRCFQMFATDISRVGYTKTGRIYSIICPQQGACSDVYGCMNVEVSVTGQRGWVDEASKLLAADMTVEAKIWFSNSGLQNQTIQELLEAFTSKSLPFPSTKANAIRIGTHRPGNPDQPIFPLRSGVTKRFISPGFSIHEEAWSVANIDVEIGAIKKTGITHVDDFNELVIEFFNLASGNLLQQGNVLSWNVWLDSPDVVDQVEWREHAEKWRESIDVEHDHGAGSIAKYFDGTPFDPVESLIEQKIKDIIAWIKANL